MCLRAHTHTHTHTGWKDRGWGLDEGERAIRKIPTVIKRKKKNSSS